MTTFQSVVHQRLRVVISTTAPMATPVPFNVPEPRGLLLGYQRRWHGPGRTNVNVSGVS
jgi:hypothetical protein